MLLSRKRNRDLAASDAAAASMMQFRHHQEMNEKCFLRDLVQLCTSREASTTSKPPNQQESSPFLLDFLRRVAKDAQLSQAGLSSQELFLSVVLEWQRSALSDASESPFADDQTGASTFSMRDILNDTRESQNGGYRFSTAASSSSNTSSSDSEADQSDASPPTKRMRRKLQSGDEESPTSVHSVPRDQLTPLRLDYDSVSPVKKKIGVYTPRSRQELLRKYMEKRARRLSQNKVRYRVRKTLANARPRVKGRFVKTEQPLTAALVEAMVTTKTES